MEDQNRDKNNIPFRLMVHKNIPGRSKSPFAVKTVKIQFGLLAPDVFHYMWAGGMWAGNRSGCDLATCR